MMRIHKLYRVIIVFDGESCICIDQSEYDQFVTDLEQVARELWPDKFKPRTLKDWADEFKGDVKDHTQDFELVHHSDGSTECRDKRMNQIPINSKKQNG